MIRIVIAEDQEMLLGVIGSLLNLEADMEVVGQAKNGEEALILMHQLQPDICIMDIEMPEMSGLEAAEAFIPAGCKVIILTTFARTGYFERVRTAGVRGYLLKDSPSEQLVGSIRSIIGGKQIYSPELMDDDSCDQEQEVLEPLVLGSVPIERSNQPHNTMGTIKGYFSTIKDKMKLPTG